MKVCQFAAAFGMTCLTAFSTPLLAGSCDSDPTIAPLVKVAQSDSKNVLAIFNLGAAYYKKGCNDEALDAFKRALDTNRGDTANHQKIDGQCYQLIGVIDFNFKKDDNEAIKYFNKALALPLDAGDLNQTHYALGLALKRQQRYEDSIAHFKKVLQTDPNNLQAQFHLTNALTLIYQNKKNDPALTQELTANLDKTVKMAMKDKQENKEILSNLLPTLAQMYRSAGNHLKAIEALKQSIQVNPDDYDSHYLLGLEYYANKEYDKMVDEYEKATKIAPAQVNAHFNLALAYANQQRYDEAVDQYKKILSIDGGNTEALLELSQVTQQAIDFHLGKGTSAYTEEKYPEALDEFTKVLALDPHNAAAEKYSKDAQSKIDDDFKKHMQAANKAKLGKNRLQELTELELALALKPNDPDAKAEKEQVGGKITELINLYFSRGKRAEDDSDYAEAITDYNKALKLSPKYAPALNALKRIQQSTVGRIRLGLAALGKNDLRKAKAQFENVLRSDSKNKEALDNLVRVNTRISEAIKKYNDLGQKAFDKGAKDEAKKNFEVTLSFDPNNKVANDFIERITGSESKQKVNADDVKKLYYKGVDYYVNGDITKAIDAWNEVLKLDPNNVEALKNKERAIAKMAAIKKLTGS